MNAFAKIRKALNTGDANDLLAAMDALAELERAAAQPVAYQYAHPYFGGGKIWREEQRWNGHTSDEARALYAAPPTPVAEIREVVYAAAEMSSRVANSYFGIDTPANMSDMLEVLRYWRRELGPMLGLVELREPTEAECDAIYFAACKDLNGQTGHEGREMFRAVRAVMFPQKSEVGL